MTTMMMDQKDKEFNHALQHLVRHWAAYIASLGILLGIGIGASSKPTGPPATVGQRICAYRIAILLTLAASVFFLRRMVVFGRELNLSEDYLKKVGLFGKDPYHLNIWASVAFACALAGLAWWLTTTASS